MPVKYQRVWDTMNSLEQIISKVVSAREMIDVANEALSYNQKERAEKMTIAAYEFLGYFIEEFDEKFKDAWQATVGGLREGDVKEDPCMPSWGHSDLEYACRNSNKVKKWILPVEIDGPSGEYFVTLPDEILDQINWKEGDTVEWTDNNDGSIKLTKVSKEIKTENY